MRALRGSSGPEGSRIGEIPSDPWPGAANEFAIDLGEIAFRRGELRTPSSTRFSYRPLLASIALRGLRLFAALVVLFILVDLTHYFL